MSERKIQKTEDAKNRSLENFETSLVELEKIIQQLESGKFGLDDNLKKFTEGVSLYKNCKSMLETAEKKIKVLTEQLAEEDFNLDEK